MNGISGSLTSVGKFFLRGLDFVLLFLLIYEIFRLLRRTNSLLMLKAAIIIGLSGLVISGLNLPILSWLIRKLGPTVITAFVIVFQFQ